MTDPNDIVKGLRSIFTHSVSVSDLCKEAADLIEQLTDDLDNERARGVHSCGPNCQRLECVQRRRIAELEQRVKNHIESAEGYEAALEDKESNYKRVFQRALDAEEKNKEFNEQFSKHQAAWWDKEDRLQADITAMVKQLALQETQINKLEKLLVVCGVDPEDLEDKE